MTVNLTVPLTTYLGLADDPGRLDGYGPVAAGLARQIIRDALRAPATASSARTGKDPTGIAWRCVVVDDQHGTVLGVGSPIHVPHHDPPARLADLIRTAEPTCCFPGCRVRARDCDLDHRIPYDPADPNGDHGGGPTCSCNIQPLCRKHHRLKTAGLIGIRVLADENADARADADDVAHDVAQRDGQRAAGRRGVVPGTLEFTTSTGLRYLRVPTRATPPAADLDDPLIATAVAHADLRAAQDAAGYARPDARTTPDDARDHGHERDDWDPEDRAWRRTLAEHARLRVKQAAQARTLLDEPPF